MPFSLILAFGGLVFSLLLSFGIFVRSSRQKKSDYEKWLDVIKPTNVIRSKRTFSKT